MASSLRAGRRPNLVIWAKILLDVMILCWSRSFGASFLLKKEKRPPFGGLSNFNYRLQLNGSESLLAAALATMRQVTDKANAPCK